MPRPNTYTLISTGLALLAGAVLAGCGGHAGDSGPEKRGFRLSGDRLTIVVGGGDLGVRPSDVDEIEVTRWFTGWSLSAAKPEARWELAGEMLTLSDCGTRGVGRCGVRYEVLVPRNVVLTVEGANGQITASGFHVGLQVSSDNGAIRVADSSGSLSLKSSNGELRATGITSGQVTVGSESGEVNLSFTNVPDRVEVTTENGAVTVELPHAVYHVVATTSSGDVRSDLPVDAGSPHAVTVRTDSGDVELRASGGPTLGGT